VENSGAMSRCVSPGIGAYPASAKRARGFSLLELMIVTIMFGVLATVLLDRLAYYEEAAEKAYVGYTISAIKSALRLRISRLMIEGRLQEAAELAQQNPMGLLDEKPANYIGELRNPDPATIPKGSWYFDYSSKILVYIVRNGRHFESGSSCGQCIQLKYVPLGNFSHSDPGSAPGSTDTIRVELVNNYRWLE